MDKKNKSFRSNKSRNNRSTTLVKKVIAISRVNKVTKGGKRLNFRAVIVVGDKAGRVGIGVAKARDVKLAIKKATEKGSKNLIIIPLTKSKSIPHMVYGKFGACDLILKPASPGSGVIAGSSIRIVLEIAGIKNILAKRLGANNLLNNAKATLFALNKLKTFRQIVIDRDLSMTHFYNASN